MRRGQGEITINLSIGVLHQYMKELLHNEVDRALEQAAQRGSKVCLSGNIQDTPRHLSVQPAVGGLLWHGELDMMICGGSSHPLQS